MMNPNSGNAQGNLGAQMMMNPGNWANPDVYATIMSAEGMKARLNPISWMSMMNPGTYAYLMDPNAYMKMMGEMMNPTFYTKMMETMMNPEMYTQWYEYIGLKAAEQGEDSVVEKTE